MNRLSGEFPSQLRYVIYEFQNYMYYRSKLITSESLSHMQRESKFSAAISGSKGVQVQLP